MDIAYNDHVATFTLQNESDALALVSKFYSTVGSAAERAEITPSFIADTHLFFVGGNVGWDTSDCEVKESSPLPARVDIDLRYAEVLSVRPA